MLKCFFDNIDETSNYDRCYDLNKHTQSYGPMLFNNKNVLKFGIMEYSHRRHTPFMLSTSLCNWIAEYLRRHIFIKDYVKY